MAGTFLNIGTLFSVSAMASAATASFVGASVFGLVSLVNLLKVRSMQKWILGCLTWLLGHRGAGEHGGVCVSPAKSNLGC